MQTQDLAEHLGLATSTIRLWSRDEFRQYLTPSAQGGEGKTRYFTELDQRIIAHIAILKREGKSADEIHIDLKRLQAVQWAGLPDMPDPAGKAGRIPMMPREVADNALSAHKSAMMREIAILQDQVEALQEQLAQERTQHETERQRLQSELLEATRRIGELQGQLGTSEGKLSERRPAEFWLLILVGAVILAMVVVFILTRQ